MSTNRRGYRGYVSSRGFGEYRIPTPLQSLSLRDYCSRNGLLYVLPVNENCFPHSYLVLEGVIADLSDFEGVVMCSMHMLPQRRGRRKHVYDRILDQGCSLHMVIEGLVVRGQGDVDAVEELLALSRIAPRLADMPPIA